MAVVEEKENIAPATIHDFALNETFSNDKYVRDKTRSRSLGLGGIEEVVANAAKQEERDARARRQTTYTPTSKPILSGDAEKAARQAARRQTLANRRVSFAPEATLHTWDVIEFMKDHTTSTDSSENTRRVSRQSQHNSPSESESEAEDERLSNTSHRENTRRTSESSRRSYSHGDDVDSSSVNESGSDQSDSEADGEFGTEDETGTAMSMDIDEATMQSAISASSTSSSARLEAALEQAAYTAGTRGIRYDEYGDDESMELAGDTVTNAFKPWVQNAASQPAGIVIADQENVNPFAPPSVIPMGRSEFMYSVTGQEEEDDEDLSMDVTHAVGGILDPGTDTTDVPAEDLSMDMTQAVGRIHGENDARAGEPVINHKRRRSATETGSPMKSTDAGRSKRRRSSVARTSVGGDATMDFTLAVGSIQNPASASRLTRRQSKMRHSISADDTAHGEMTMDFTQAVGTIQRALPVDHTASSIDENEELTMEFTTAVGVIRRPDHQDKRHITPDNGDGEILTEVTQTPSNPHRFKETPGSIKGKLLTPILQKSVTPESRRSNSPKKVTEASPSTPRRRTRSSSARLVTEQENVEGTPEVESNAAATPKTSILSPGSVQTGEVGYPVLPALETYSPVVPQTPVPRTSTPRSAPNTSMSQRQAEAQMEEVELSPSIKQQQKISPAKPIHVDDSAVKPGTAKSLVQSLKLLSTPRKEVLRNMSPNRFPSVLKASPVRPLSIRRGPQMAENIDPLARSGITPSKALPIRKFGEEIVEKIHLQEFLESAGIRFMDLTATKQRLTAAPTPSRIRSRGTEPVAQSLASAICVSTCTVPELEMYRHACNELKHSMNDGKKIIKQLEANAFTEPPPLIVAYQHADAALKAELDTQMRDVRTDARLESKSAWYKWRGQLLSDLTQHLTGMAEGLLKDHEVMQDLERVVEESLPDLVQQHQGLTEESAQLKTEMSSVSQEEKQRLKEVREKLSEIDVELQQKRELLSKLQREADEQDTVLGDLTGRKKELMTRIDEAERLRNASRGVSRKQVNKLKGQIELLEQSLGWTITAAKSSPTIVTMVYRSELQLFLHPAHFASATGPADHQHNETIKIQFIRRSSVKSDSKESPIIRFFLNGLQHALDEIFQPQTLLTDVIGFVSSYWDLAQSVMEAERRVGLETIVSSHIDGKDKLAVNATILLPKVRTKLRVTFELAARTDVTLVVTSNVHVKVSVVYGEKYDEPGMIKFVQSRIGEGAEGWEIAVRDLMDKLIVQGPAKGARK